MHYIRFTILQPNVDHITNMKKTIEICSYANVACVSEHYNAIHAENKIETARKINKQFDFSFIGIVCREKEAAVVYQ